MKSALIFLIASLMVCGLHAQEKTRDLKREGLTFTLPGAWAWQSDFGSNLAIKMTIPYATGPIEIFGELLSADDVAVDDEIAKLEAKVKAGGPDFRDFAVDRNSVFGGAKAVIVRLTRVRNEGKELSEERTFLQRRGALLLTWREENRKEVAAAASSAFSAARAAMKFREGSLPKAEPPRVWKDLGLKVSLPEAWKWIAERQEPQEQGSATLTVMQGDVAVKKGDGYVNLSVNIQKYAGTLAQLVDSNRTSFTDGVDGTSGLVIEPKAIFRGEKAAFVSFQGSIKGNKHAFRRWFIKRKAYMISIQVTTPPTDDPAMVSAIKKAESSVTFN